MNFAHSEVATLDPNTMRTLCEEYVANNYIDPETSERLGVKRGLRNPDGTGVLAGLTNVCDVVGYKKDQEGHVIPTPGKLIYRGVNINEIVDEAYRNDRFVFEEVIWLLCPVPGQRGRGLARRGQGSHHLYRDERHRERHEPLRLCHRAAAGLL